MREPVPFLEWWVQHPAVWLAVVGGLLGLGLVLAARALPPDRAGSDRTPDPAWGGLLLLILAAGRWPSWLATIQFNADESQLLAGAHALTHDPVFWRSVTGGTAGPLDFFALWPAGWLGGWAGYLPARLTAFALLGVSLALIHSAMARVLGRGPARVASLALVAFEALTNAPDFLHYSTEILPVALLAGAAYAAVRRMQTADGAGWNALGAVLLGAVPLAKLQPAPLAAALGLTWVGLEFTSAAPGRARRLAALVLGALLPAAFFAGQLTIAGEWRNFHTSYFLYNLNYAATGSRDFHAALLETWNNSLWWDSLLERWVPAMLGCGLLLLRFRPVPDRAVRRFTWAAAAACVIALGCIVSPGRPFLHYWHLFVLPAGCLLGALVARQQLTAPAAAERTETTLAVLALGGLLGLLLVHRAVAPNAFVRGLVHYHQHPRGALPERVAAHARPGEKIAVWGWTNDVYAETGLLQATRDPHIGPLVEPGPLREYFRARYLADFARSRPELFLDSVGPASLNYVGAEFAHDRDCTELAAIIRADYVLVEEPRGARLYRRRDAPAP